MIVECKTGPYISWKPVPTGPQGWTNVCLSICLNKALSLASAASECCCLTDRERSNPMNQLFFFAIGHKLPIKPQREGRLFTHTHTQRTKLEDTVHAEEKRPQERLLHQNLIPREPHTYFIMNQICFIYFLMPASFFQIKYKHEEL